MQAPDYDQLRRMYSLYTNDELVRLAAESEGLTSEARDALRFEIRQRGLERQDTSAEPVQAAAQLPSETKVQRISRWNWIWPVITNENEAKNAAKSGAGGALIVAVCTGGLAILAITTGRSYAGIDGYGLFDAIMFALIAWRIFRYSFPWAVFGLLLEVAELCWKLSNYPSSMGVITVIILLALIASVRGTAFLSKRGNLNGLLAAIVVIVFAVGFAVIVHRSVQPSPELRDDALDASSAAKLEDDFLSLNMDYDADDWGEFRTELLSREHYLDDLKEKDRRIQLLLREEPAESDKCGRLGEQSLQGVITAEENLMSFAKTNTVLTDDSSTSARSLMAQSRSASQQWNSYVDNIKTCDDSK